MQNVITAHLLHTRNPSRIGRFLSVGLLVASTAVGAWANEERAPQPAPVQIELKTEAEPVLLANPLKRPKEKIPHITYQRRTHYYC